MKLASGNIYVETNTPNGSQFESKQRQYTFNDIVKITNDFTRILGRGGSGIVYHGFIDDTEVAVKMLSASSLRGYEQFQAEASGHYLHNSFWVNSTRSVVVMTKKWPLISG